MEVVPGELLISDAVLLLGPRRGNVGACLIAKLDGACVHSGLCWVRQTRALCGI